MSKNLCRECDGYKLISECCYFAINETKNEKHVCGLCNKFCKVHHCDNCDNGYEIDEEE